MYVAVIGNLKGVQDKKRATAFAVRYFLQEYYVPVPPMH